MDLRLKPLLKQPAVGRHELPLRQHERGDGDARDDGKDGENEPGAKTGEPLHGG